MALTVERMDEIFDVDPAKGSIIWRAPPFNHPDLMGKEAGTTNCYGYVQIRIDGRIYRRARLIWFYVHGTWPSKQVDHENLVKTDDRLENLREASSDQNQWNTSVRKNNLLKAKGIDWRPDKKRYRARVVCRGITTQVGYFRSLDEAIAARAQVVIKLHGEFARAA